jgi:hypothetical protein
MVDEKGAEVLTEFLGDATASASKITTIFPTEIFE